MYFGTLAATFGHLFGPPTPAAVRRMRNKKFYGDDIPNVRKSKKPLPGILGNLKSWYTSIH